MGKSGRVLAGGVWAAWLRLCEAVVVVCGVNRGVLRLAMRSFEMMGWFRDCFGGQSEEGRWSGWFSWVLRF